MDFLVLLWCNTDTDRQSKPHCEREIAYKILTKC